MLCRKMSFIQRKTKKLKTKQKKKENDKISARSTFIPIILQRKLLKKDIFYAILIIPQEQKRQNIF